MFAIAETMLNRKSPLKIFYEPARVDKITERGADIEIYAEVYVIGRDEHGNPYVIGEFEKIERKASVSRGIEIHFLPTSATVEYLNKARKDSR